MKAQRPALHGAILVDKPRGPSSFSVVARIRGATRSPGEAKPRVGHAGTLDPFATGLLVICLGEATKLLPHMLGSSKTYLATMQWGSTTVSGDDCESISQSTAQLPASLEQIREAASGFVGDYLQTPPMHSAIKQDGKRLYELARQGLEVERAPKLKRIHSLDILDYDGVTTRFRVRCSSGTYVRTLAQDLAQRLGSLAHLSALRREVSGELRVQDALTLEVIEKSGPAIHSLPQWIELGRLARTILPSCDISSDLANSIRRGQQQDLNSVMNALDTSRPDPVALLADGRLVATVQRSSSAWEILRVFVPEV